MAKNDLQGTLDLLILKSLAQLGPMHGYGIVMHIGRVSDELLRVEEGSLYPALHRMERKGWIVAKWEMAKDRNREFKYYRLTPAGKKQLVREQSRWKQLAAAVATVLRPAPGD